MWRRSCSGIVCARGALDQQHRRPVHECMEHSVAWRVRHVEGLLQIHDGARALPETVSFDMILPGELNHEVLKRCVVGARNQDLMVVH